MAELIPPKELPSIRTSSWLGPPMVAFSKGQLHFEKETVTLSVAEEHT